MVGAASIAPGSHQQLYKSIEKLDRGSLRHRLKFVTLAGELAGPDEALRRLKAAEAERPPAEEDRPLVEALRRLYTMRSALGDFSAPDRPKPDFAQLLPEEDRRRIVAALDWFGELALAPSWTADEEARTRVLRPARATAVAMLAGFLVGLLLIVVGLVVLVVFLVFFFQGRITPGIGEGHGPGGVYAETFALWLLLFTGLTLAAALLPAGRSRIGLGGLATVASLGVLAWPVFRGVPWTAVRADLGLDSGRGVLWEALSGMATYLMSLPLLAIGLIVMLVFLPDAGRSASHPIAGELGTADGWLIAQLFFAACVAAPLVEETLFRGVLYRHLRDTSRGWGFAGSVLVSALVNSFLFAVIHPQGLGGVPVLMGLAMGFTLGREWRGSLIAGMVAHAINNGLVMLFLLTTVSG